MNDFTVGLGDACQRGEAIVTPFEGLLDAAFLGVPVAA